MDTRQLLDSVDAANRRIAAALGQETLAWNDAVKAQAEHALAGEIYRAPDGAWTRVDFAQPVDWDARTTVNPAHIVMVLRRFHLLGPLAAGYRATGDERYAQAARRAIAAFLRDDPPRADWAPQPLDGDTQYDIRLGVWLGALSHFRRSPAFDAALVGQVLDAARLMAAYLSAHVKPDRNIRFWHGLVLLEAGLRLGALPEAAAWQQQGTMIVNDAIRRQVLPDGVHMEATPGYHHCVMDLVNEAWRLAQAMPELGLHVPTALLAAMHDYALAVTRPDGATVTLHDTCYVAATKTPDMRMQEARAAFRRLAGLPDSLPPPVQWFPHANQVLLRDDWTPGAAYLTFDAATRRSFHWHPSRNSITLFAHGRALVVDPGYVFANAEFPRYGDQTAHHSTITFNGWDQGDWPATVRAATAPGYTLVEGLYGGGYWPAAPHGCRGPGLYGEHHRVLLWVHGRFGLVLDHVRHMCGTGQKPTVELCWQLSEGPAAADATARQVVTRHERGNLLLQFPLLLPDTTLTMHTGEREPLMRGWLPIEWGRRCIPAPLVRLTAPNYDPWNGDLATVLTPFPGATPPAVRAAATGPEALRDSRRAGNLTLTHADGTRDVIIWTRRLQHAIGQQHGCDTDAALVHLRLDAAGAVAGGLFADGTHCTFAGADLTARLSRLDRLPTMPVASGL